MSFFVCSVIETNSADPRLRRIRCSRRTEALEVKPGGDSAVGVYFPSSRPTANASRRRSSDGPDGTRYVDRRRERGSQLSVRYHASDRIELDVILHARGARNDVGQRDRPGDRVGLDHADRGTGRADDPLAVLVTDLSGLPATARIISKLPGASPSPPSSRSPNTKDLDYLPTHRTSPS